MAGAQPICEKAPAAERAGLLITGISPTYFVAGSAGATAASGTVRAVPIVRQRGVRACRAVRSSLAADVEPVSPRRPLAAQDRYRRARAEPQPVAGPEPCHTWAWIAS